MPKAVDVALKQQEFITASIDVIARQGLAAATMRRIADQAGCTTGALTHYFPNRNAILKETLTAVHKQAAARMLNIQRSTLPQHEKLNRVLLESLPLDEVRLTEWRVWLSFWSAAMDDPELTRENTNRYREWSGLVTDLLTPLLKPVHVADQVARLVALVDGLGVGIVRQKTSTRRLAAESARCETLLSGYVVEMLDQCC